MRRVVLGCSLMITLLIGGSGQAGEWIRVDDFQAYMPDVFPLHSNSWFTADEQASQVMVCQDTLAAGNQAVRLHRRVGTKSGEHDILFQAGALGIEPGKVGTVFMRFLIESGLDKSLGSTRGEKPIEHIHLKFAVTEQRLHAGNPRFGVVIQGLESSLTGLGLPRSGSKACSIKRNRWYRLWLVIDNRPAGSGSLSKALLLEEGAGGQPQELPCALEASTSSQPGMLTGVGIIKSRDNGLTDVFIDDLFVDNGGQNVTDPLTVRSGVMGWREKLLAEARQYEHLRKKATTWEAAEQQADAFVQAMKPAERFALVCGDGHLGLPAFMRLGIPGINFSDASSGINNGNGPVGSRHARTVAHPCTLLLAATWNRKLANDYGRAIGEECRSGGTHVLLGPGVNLYRVSAGGRNFEYLGEDPLLTGMLAEQYIRGVQSTGTGATLKHFIANEIEFHRRGSNSRMDERTLHEVYMEPFRRGIEAGAFAVMTSYNQLNGEWAGQCRYINTELLRNTLGFRGISMTDWISTYEGVKLAQSGTDLEMPGGGALKRDRGQVFGTPEIDRMAKRIMASCIYAGFYEHPQPDAACELRRPVWEETARRVNAEGIVLLRNAGHLPLETKQTGKKILVAGNFSQRERLAGEGSGHVKGYALKTYAQALKETFTEAEVTCVEHPEATQIREADRIFLFSGFTGEGEGRDTRFVLPDEELIVSCVNMNPHTVICITSGCGVRMDWSERAAAILYGMFGGQTGASVLMDVVKGNVTPSGRLPFTIEQRLEDAPGYAALAPMPDKERGFPADLIPDFVKGEYYVSDDKQQCFLHNVDYSEGVFVGYRWYTSKKIPVRYPFGFGLSYTTFTYEDLQVKVSDPHTVMVHFTLRNTGKRSGAEVAQIYVRDVESSVPRPLQELKAFEKVELQPGQAKQVMVSLDAYAFRFWHPTKKTWVVEPGRFEIRVGASATDIRLVRDIHVN